MTDTLQMSVIESVPWMTKMSVPSVSCVHSTPASVTCQPSGPAPNELPVVSAPLDEMSWLCWMRKPGSAASPRSSAGASWPASSRVCLVNRVRVQRAVRTPASPEDPDR
ncbi:MAG: hypothetical protein K2X87_30540, partial [Gemmataceae bacterium]|nr:hypothetical protein [Gemmataceae bacterium]